MTFNKQIKFDLKHLHKKLEYITGIITDLHVDWHKLKGIDGRSSLPHVAAAIHAGDYNGIVTAIMGGMRQQQQQQQHVYLEQNDMMQCRIALQ